MYSAPKLNQISRTYSVSHSQPLRLRFFSARQLDQIPQITKLPHEVRFAMQVVARVLPFRVNQYVIENRPSRENETLEIVRKRE